MRQTAINCNMNQTNFSKYNNRFFFIVLLIVTTLFNETNCQTEKDDVGYFQLAFSTNVFKGVYLNDAIAGAKVLTEELLKEFSEIDYKVASPVTFSNTEELKSLIKTKAIEVYIMHPTEYIKLSSSKKLEPICVAARDGNPYDVFYLLVNKKSNYKRVKDLINKKVLVGSPFQADLPNIWLEYLLRQKKLKPCEKYFSKIEYLEKGLPAILPVFLNKADACIVPKNIFDTVCELNPQIKKELIVIEKSEPIAIGVVAIRKSISNQRTKTAIKKALLNLDKTKSGHQYLTVFKLSNLIKFNDKYMLSTIKMVNFLNN